MKLSQTFFYTLREAARDEDLASANLLVRAGLIRKLSSGSYAFSPLGLTALRQIEERMRTSMEDMQIPEIMTPQLIPEEIYEQSGRRDEVRAASFGFYDRQRRPYILNGHPEEAVMALARMHIKSYKNLPFTLYQFQNCLLDNPHPHSGLFSTKEDRQLQAFKFDADPATMEGSYMEIRERLLSLLQNLGLNAVLAISDREGEAVKKESFFLLSEAGDTTLATEKESGYAAMLSMTRNPVEEREPEEPQTPTEHYTPNARTIEEVVEFMQEDPDRFVKTMVYIIDEEPFAICVRGDHEIDEEKVLRALQRNNMELAPEEILEELTGAPLGFAGPVKLNMPILVDRALTTLSNFIVGANKADHHLSGVNLKDFKAYLIEDLRVTKEGDLCENGQGPVSLVQGFELGSVEMFSDRFKEILSYTDIETQPKGVCVTRATLSSQRVLAALAEVYATEKGFQWPQHVSPVEVSIVLINQKDEAQNQVAQDLYRRLAPHYRVMLDDRDDRAGVKFNDSELIGSFLRLTVGKAVKEDKVELKLQGEDNRLIAIDDVEEELKNILG